MFIEQKFRDKKEIVEVEYCKKCGRNDGESQEFFPVDTSIVTLCHYYREAEKKYPAEDVYGYFQQSVVAVVVRHGIDFLYLYKSNRIL